MTRRNAFIACGVAAAVAGSAALVAERTNQLTAPPELPVPVERISTAQPAHYLCADARAGTFFAFSQDAVKRAANPSCVAFVDDDGHKRNLCEIDREFVTCLQVKH